MAKTSAQDVCHQLLHQLRLSNLHFALSETPHSAQIMLRKRFLKGSEGPAFSVTSDTSSGNLEHEINVQKKENIMLKDKVKTLQAQNKSCIETVEILEDKIAKIEACALKSFEEKKVEADTLKKNSKTLREELETTKKDVKFRDKTIKEKEKEAYRLGQKNDNLGETVKRLKTEISTLKHENKNLVKQQKPKLKKTQSVSTNTLSDFSAGSLNTPFMSNPSSQFNSIKATQNSPTFQSSSTSQNSPTFQNSPTSQNSPISQKSPSSWNSPTCQNMSSMGISNCLSVALPPETENVSSSLSALEMSIAAPSMVSHWTPITYTSPQRPGSLPSMITHCALLPNPGSFFVSMEEVMEAMNKMFEQFRKQTEN